MSSIPDLKHALPGRNRTAEKLLDFVRENHSRGWCVYGLATKPRPRDRDFALESLYFSTLLIDFKRSKVERPQLDASDLGAGLCSQVACSGCVKPDVCAAIGATHNTVEIPFDKKRCHSVAHRRSSCCDVSVLLSDSCVQSGTVDWGGCLQPKCLGPSGH